jgi:hypothetical protein
MPSPYELPMRWLEWHEGLLDVEKEREQCCKDICGHCDDGLIPIREEYEKPRFVLFDNFGCETDYCWRHREAEPVDEDRVYACDASAIRERAWQEQQSTPPAPESG